MVRALKFRIHEVEGLYYICSESIGAGRRAADMCLCFRICNIRFSHGAAQSMYQMALAPVAGKSAIKSARQL